MELEVIKWIRKQWRLYRRWVEADDKGWVSLGRMFSSDKSWSSEMWEREIRHSNRLYRLTRDGGNAWKKGKRDF